MNQTKSMIECAIELMKTKKKPHTLKSIAKEVFEMQGLKVNEHPDLYSQFVSDFMLCGYFIYCGEIKDKKGVKLWDIKTRQHSSLLENDAEYTDPYENDEEVVRNELKDETEYLDKEDGFVDNTDSDDQYDMDEEKEEKDDIEEALSEDGIEYDSDELFEDDTEEDSFDDEDIN